MVPLFVAFLLPYINRPILLGIGAVGIAYACWLSRLLAPTTIRPEEQDRIPRAKLHYALSALCLLLIFMGYDILGTPFVLTVASLIPLGISMGLAEQYYPAWNEPASGYIASWRSKAAAPCEAA
jgi:hypothetical protein